MHRLYCPQTDFSVSPIIITDPKEIHHLNVVLRLKNKQQIHVFNGQGEEALATILAITPHKINLQIDHVYTSETDSPKMILACAVPKKGKFETIIEKATELGVAEIIPLKTQRTEIQLKGERLHKKTVRFQTVAVNAAKQSKRKLVPHIHPLTEFISAIQFLTTQSTTIIPSLMGDRIPLINALQKIKEPKIVSFVIGPEGDFTPEEYAYAHKKGCIAVSLGQNILKVETAAITALACAHIFLIAHHDKI